MRAGDLKFRRVMHSPKLWGFSYLALIPIFATIYAGLSPGSFNDSNLRKEAAVAYDAAHLRSVLTSAITDRVQRTDWFAQGSHLVFDQASVSVSGIGYRSEGKLLLEVSGRFQSTKPNELMVGPFTEFVTIEPSESLLVVKENSKWKDVISVTLSRRTGQKIDSSNQPFISPPVELLFPALHRSWAVPNPPGRGLLLVSAEIHDDLRRFNAARGGDPSYASNTWWRMAYLSIVTATTLGFGDITPVSEAARILVGLEAIVGVIMIGLFLNALAARARDS